MHETTEFSDGGGDPVHGSVGRYEIASVGVPPLEVKWKCVAKHRELDASEEHLRRLRRICTALPGTTERLSHGEPTFFAAKKVYAMFDNNHHNDGHIAVWLPAPPGVQAALVHASPEKYFKPPYVGVRGWIGVELNRVSDEELGSHVLDAWRMIAPKKLQGGSGAHDR
jgi:hypothetical protein